MREFPSPSFGFCNSAGPTPSNAGSSSSLPYTFPLQNIEKRHFASLSLTPLQPPNLNLGYLLQHNSAGPKHCHSLQKFDFYKKEENLDMEMGSGLATMPNWLEKLLSEKFFIPCGHHEGIKKNEKNILCLDCCFGFCPHCISPHRSHRLLQIRRYVYHDVVRVEDLEKLIDMSAVQSYTTNSSKVAFLKQRPQNRTYRGSGNGCRSCDRPLQDSFLYCSLSCKVKRLMQREGELSRHLRKCDYLPLSIDEDGHLTPDSILELPCPDSSSSMGNMGSKEPFFGCGGGDSLRAEVERAASLRKRWRKRPRPNRSPLF